MIEEKDIKVGLKFRICKADEQGTVTYLEDGRVRPNMVRLDLEIVDKRKVDCECKLIDSEVDEIYILLKDIMQYGEILPIAKKECERIKKESEQVNHPSHYSWLREKCLVEPIDICRHLDFNIGCAVKYLLRKGKKEEGLSETEQRIQDLHKARFYIEDEITSVLGGKLK